MNPSQLPARSTFAENDAPVGDLERPPNYLRPAQVDELTEQIDTIESQLRSGTLQEPDVARKRLRKARATLARDAPPEVNASQRDQLAREIQELEEQIVPHLLSRDEMMRNPQGALGRYLRGEASPRVKRMILSWKAKRLALHRGDPDPDVANIERLRPEGAHLPMEGAQIPRRTFYSFPSAQYQAGHDRIFGSEENPVVEALHERIERLEARLALAAGEETAEAGEKDLEPSGFAGQDESEAPETEEAGAPQ